jgi:hypothetical protein
MTNFVPKLRIHRQHMAATVRWYEEQLVMKYGLLVQTPALQELMRREFEMIQIQKRNFEKTNSWLVPLKLDFASIGTWQVSIADASMILYLD